MADARAILAGLAARNQSAEPIVREMSPNEIYAAFVELASNDRTYLDRLAHRFEWKAPFSKAKPVEPCPLVQSGSIEIALHDKGPPKKTKRDRPDRVAMRFGGKIKVCKARNKVLSKPDWSGYIDFRDGARAVKDAAKHRREGNFSSAFEAMVQSMVAQAAGTDTMFAFFRAITEEQGSPHCDGFLVTASASDLEAHAPTLVIHILDAKGRAEIALPAFDTRTNKGGPLGSGFVVQCRASRDPRPEWATGRFGVQRL